MDNNQEEQKRGPISQTIDTINNIPIRPGVLGKVGSSAARGLATAFGAIPFWVWIVVGIIILATIVFIIVFSGAAPGAPSQTTTQTPAP